jgi:hypothetical protein
MRTLHLLKGNCVRCHKKLPDKKMEFEVIQRIYETKYTGGDCFSEYRDYRDTKGIPYAVKERLKYSFCSKGCLFKAIKQAYYSEVGLKAQKTRRKNEHLRRRT